MKAMNICIYVEKEREIDFRELAHVIMETGKSKFCRVVQQTGNPGEQCCFEVWISSAGRIPPCWWVGRSVFVLFRPLTDWTDPTHTMECNLLYSKLSNLNVDHVQRHPHRNVQNNVSPNVWAPWPSQVDT